MRRPEPPPPPPPVRVVLALAVVGMLVSVFLVATATRAYGVVVPDAVADPETYVEPAPVAPPEPEPAAIPEPWASLAECESHGEWDYGPHSGWGSGIYEGGLQFHPDTWDAYRDPDHPPAAYLASPAQQIEVAQRVLADQTWAAWPACSRKLGLR